MRSTTTSHFQRGEIRIGRKIKVGRQVRELRTFKVQAFQRRTGQDAEVADGAFLVVFAGGAADDARQEAVAKVELMVAQSDRIETEFILNLNVGDALGAKRTF